MSLFVHLAYEAPAESLATLRAHTTAGIDITAGDMPDDPRYQIVVAGRPERHVLDASPHLHTLIIPFAGLPTSTRETLRDYPTLAVHNLHHNAPPTAEMALTLLLAVAKRTVPVDRALRQHDWTPRYAPTPLRLLKGKTALIVGYGAVGQYLGAILTAMQLRVIGVRRTHADDAQEIYSIERLPDLLPRADVLILAVPGTPATEGLIGSDELARLPADAIVINVGRGTVIDQHALYDALQSGALFGAGLDVWYNYPSSADERSHTPPADVPFHTLDNVVLSPHRGGGGRHAEIEQARMHALADMLNRAHAGDPLPHRVDLDAGY